MFFCHALEVQRKELESEGKDTSVFPIVRCFERSAGPGGAWRSDRTHDDAKAKANANSGRPVSPATIMAHPWTEEKKEDCFWNDDKVPLKTKQKTLKGTVDQQNQQHMSSMYSGLWTNGAKEMYEMSDYTFRDHFGDVRMPTHLPRKHVLEYLLARVTRNCPDFFERCFSFRTAVTNVRYLGDDTECQATNKKFRVCTFDETTGAEDVQFFDKCVWAGGVNGIPITPRDTVKLFEEGGFPGRIVHSSDTSTFKEDVNGKTVLIVGGGLSAEDLALMAIKEGVSKVYCTFRYFDSELAETSRWPYDRIVPLPETEIEQVNGSEVTLSGVYYRVKKQEYIIDNETDKLVLSGIDTVIFCTGYKYNVSMLDEALQRPIPSASGKLPIPEDWTVRENKLSQAILGDRYKVIVPKNHKVVRDKYLQVYPHSKDLYKGTFWIDNPNMMYLQEYGEGPLMAIEVNSWMMARVVSNQIALPSEEEMRADNRRIVGECLQCPTLRYQMDWKYQDAIDDAIEEDESLERLLEEELWDEAREMADKVSFRLLGEVMNQYGYPVSYLRPDGRTFSRYYDVVRVAFEADSRDKLDKLVYNTDHEPDGWRSFRDYPDIEKITSYFTGIQAKRLPKPWMELDDDDDELW
jgi:thioredoxin reductase